MLEPRYPSPKIVIQSFLTHAETRVVQVVEGPRGTNDDGQHTEHAHSAAPNTSIRP